MKKKIAILMLCATVLASVLPMTVGAAGMILAQDSFDTENEEIWSWDRTLFEVIDGHLEGYAGAVVQETRYTSYEGNMEWGNGTSFQIEAFAYDDDRGDGNNELKLWWADYFEEEHQDGPSDRIVYAFGYNYSSQKYVFYVNFEEGADSYSPTGDNLFFEFDAPEYKMDMSKPDHIKLGLKILDGKVYCYDGETLIYAHEAERGALLGTGAKSPLLLWNTGCYCGWDNFIVATADYGLFGENKVADTTQAPSNDETTTAEETTKVETKTVVVTDENGDAHTEIVTEIVTNAPKQDTQKQSNSNNNSNSVQTGDVMVIVVAVMVTALGAAIVVKKVNA